MSDFVIESADGSRYLSLWGWGAKTQALRFPARPDAEHHLRQTGEVPGAKVVPAGAIQEKGALPEYSPWAKRAHG
jgi:hypothetical protein